MRNFIDSYGVWILTAAWWLFVGFCAFHREIESWLGGAL